MLSRKRDTVGSKPGFTGINITMAGYGTDSGSGDSDDVLRRTDLGPASEEVPSPMTQSVEEVWATIRHHEALRDDIVRDIRAHGINFPSAPDFQDVLMADYSACRSSRATLAQLFFRLGMIMSSLLDLYDRRIRLAGVSEASVTGIKKLQEQATFRHNQILTGLAKVLADDPEARSLTISELARRLAPFFADEKRGFSAGNIRTLLRHFADDVLKRAAEPRFAGLKPAERIQAIAEATRGKPGYSVEMIEVVLRR